MREDNGMTILYEFVKRFTYTQKSSYTTSKEFIPFFYSGKSKNEFIPDPLPKQIGKDKDTI